MNKKGLRLVSKPVEEGMGGGCEVLEERVSKTAFFNWVKALMSSEPSAPFSLFFHNIYFGS